MSVVIITEKVTFNRFTNKFTDMVQTTFLSIIHKQLSNHLNKNKFNVFKFNIDVIRDLRSIFHQSPALMKLINLLDNKKCKTHINLYSETSNAVQFCDANDTLIVILDFSYHETMDNVNTINKLLW